MIPFHAKMNFSKREKRLIPKNICTSADQGDQLLICFSGGSRGGSGGSLEPHSPPPVFKYPMKMK